MYTVKELQDELKAAGVGNRQRIKAGESERGGMTRSRYRRTMRRMSYLEREEFKTNRKKGKSLHRVEGQGRQTVPRRNVR